MKRKQILIQFELKEEFYYHSYMNFQKKLRKFLEKLWLNSVFIANFIQGIWWVSNTLWLTQPINYFVFILQLACLLVRCFQQLLITKEYGLKLVIHVVSLLYYVTYFESFLLIKSNQHLQVLTNCLLLIFTYMDYLKIAMLKYGLICKLGIPLYLIIRIIYTLINDFSLYELESLIIISLLFIKYTIMLQITFNKIIEEKTNKYQLTIKEERDSTPILQNQQIFPQIKSQSKISQSPQHNLSVFIRDPPSDMRLIQCSNLSNFQKINKSFEKSDHSMSSFYNNLLNLFPQGILILNSQLSVSYMNNKCEKLLDCQGSEKVLEKVKACVDNAKIRDQQWDEQSSFQSKYQSKQFHYHLLKEIICLLQKKSIPIDVFDIMIQPQKYQYLFETNSNPMFADTQLNFMSQVFIYEWFIKSGLLQNSSQKKLKLIIIPTSMTNQQQEYFQSSSQIQSCSRVNFQPTNEIENPILLIIIKNITQKHKFQQLRDEQIIHHSLIKSFSHELRTPLNSCQHMLNLLKQQQSKEEFKQCLAIAQNSNALLIHQINDIIDYAAIQSYQFSYHISQFPINQMIQEIEKLYNDQMLLKRIQFKILISKNLVSFMMCNDKQRILQILVNLLNNSIKFTKEGGCIHLSFIEKELSSINIEVKDNGIGIAEEQLHLIQSSLYSTMELGAILKSNFEIKKKGLGLSIVAKLAQGLTESQDNQLIIRSIKNQGTQVSFQVDNLQFNQNIYQQSSNLFTQQTGKFNQSERLYTFNKIKLDEKGVKQMNYSSSKVQDVEENQNQNSETYKGTSRLNDFEIQQEILLPISVEYFPHKFISSCKNLDLSKSLQQKLICQNCIQVLVVDDIPFNQIALKMILKHYNIEADSVFDGFQAIEKVKHKMQQHCQIYQLIFMDIEMPGMDGFQTSKQILKLTQKQSTIVICSAYDTQENYIKGSKLGIDTFLPKPVNQEELEVILSKLFNIKEFIK
ncbi:unnamed protein product [Paramecium pentaurelia]|uniref:Uncharacterized protein n=1 Tax=Paramecium pentaurelia TaxID=43138 RepID=A0A8S1X8J3_9CILI|nr:unnamed protein product [Paramecium pentaurelia]